MTRAWAALLAAGPGAALGGETALWLWGVVETPARLQLCVPWERKVVELDGLAAHPEWLRHLDRRRDNSGTVRWDRVLQYGWHEVVADPCRTAHEIAVVLWQQGWRTLPTPCTPTCPLGRFLG